jgi:hypothetical protein
MCRLQSKSGRAERDQGSCLFTGRTNGNNPGFNLCNWFSYSWTGLRQRSAGEDSRHVVPIQPDRQRRQVDDLKENCKPMTDEARE